jgi:hypothetical protein
MSTLSENHLLALIIYCSKSSRVRCESFAVGPCEDGHRTSQTRYRLRSTPEGIRITFKDSRPPKAGHPGGENSRHAYERLCRLTDPHIAAPNCPYSRIFRRKRSPSMQLCAQVAVMSGGACTQLWR